MQKLPSYTFTRQGFEEVQQEFEKLTAARPAAIEDLQKARALGDLKENGYYQASRQKVNSIDRRLRQLKLFIKYGKVVEATQTETVQVGNTVTVTDGEKERIFMIVGSHEADPSAGKLSDRSPIGRALLGRKVEERIAISVPSGMFSYTIKKIT
jgi:transcription elongation factor GreA